MVQYYIYTTLLPMHTVLTT